MTSKGTAYKLSDADIRSVIGVDQFFDVMFDQSGFHPGYSTGNFEYVVIYNYTAQWSYTSLMPESTTPTTMVSYRISDNAVAHTFEMYCGDVGGHGINCLNMKPGSTTPQAGAGCSINMGSRTNSGWHHLYMSNTNTDSYIYICNGPQHSSGQNFNHVRANGHELTPCYRRCPLALSCALSSLLTVPRATVIVLPRSATGSGPSCSRLLGGGMILYLW